MSRILIDGRYLVTEPGITGELSDANGLTTISVPVNFPTLAEAYAMNPASVARQVGITGLVKLVGSPITQSETMEVLVTYRFSGVAPTWTFAQAQERATYQLLGIDSEAPVGAHPNLVNLKTKYGWVPDDPADPEGPGHFPYFKPDNTTKSPMYGVESFYTTGAEFRKTYVVTSVPPSVMSAVGTIIAVPPDLNKAFGLGTPAGRKWLVKMPQLDKTLGAATRVTECWKMTGPNFQQDDLWKYSGTL